MGWDLRLYLHCDIYLSSRTGCCQEEGQGESQEAGREAGQEAGREVRRHAGLTALPPHPTLPTEARAALELNCGVTVSHARGRVVAHQLTSAVRYWCGARARPARSHCRPVPSIEPYTPLGKYSQPSFLSCFLFIG